MPEQTTQAAEKAVRRRWSLLIVGPSGDEVRVSLHPVSLARVLVEVLEDATEAWCRKRGHDAAGADHCQRCGRGLPDNGPYGWWLPTAYRSITRATPPDSQHPDGTPC